MQYYNGRMNDIKVLELTRNSSFVDGEMDIFDLLVAQKRANEQIEHNATANNTTLIAKR